MTLKIKKRPFDSLLDSLRELLGASLGLVACVPVLFLNATQVYAADTVGTQTPSGRVMEDQKKIVDGFIKPVMTRLHIPGMAVGLVCDGKASVFNYGVQSIKTNQPVSDKTLFEIGSVSKTFTATLASYAQVKKKLLLSDVSGKYISELEGTKFGAISLLNLATHTSGGLPLQLPDNIHTHEQLIKFCRDWKESTAPGTHRNYSNPGIGMLGLITASAFGQPFEHLIETTLFSPLGLTDTYISVPANEQVNYAQGYTDNDAPTRMSTSVISSQAYGIKTTAADMTRYIEGNMSMLNLDKDLKQAINDTHTGYYKAGGMTQDLVWEQYSYPVKLSALLEGNSPNMIYKTAAVTAISPAEKPHDYVWINKTGSTNGFATYVAFVPVKHLGIVILANKTFSIKERVALAHQILESLVGKSSK